MNGELLCAYLRDERKDYVLSNQLMRSGTSVGAMIREAEHAESKADFIHKMAIAQKEANETAYWLELMDAAGIYIPGTFWFGRFDVVGKMVQIEETNVGIA